MSRVRRRLAALSAVGLLCSAVFAAHVQATPSTSLTAAAADTIVSFAERDGVAHHNGDPRQGSVQVQALVQLRTDSAGALSIRATASLTKVDHAVRVQIDRIRLNSMGLSDGGPFYPELTSLNSTPVNSGAAPAVTQSTAWMSLYQLPTGRGIDYVSALVEYTTRWSDGTLTRGDFRSNVFQDGNRSERGPFTTDTRPVDAVGSTTVTHRTRSGTGSVRIDAGLRLYRSSGGDPRFAIFGLQPFATISKKSGATTVQIDSIEALGHPDLDANGTLDDSEHTATTAWPFNAVDRSSGAGASASLSTAITRVTPRREGLLSFFEVAVYYSVRWSDGSLTTGRYVTPLSALRFSFVGQQGP